MRKVVLGVGISLDGYIARLNGDVDFLRAIRAYREVGYNGMLMPDHVPKIDGDEGGRQAFAYCFGYIQALIQMVNEEG